MKFFDPPNLAHRIVKGEVKSTPGFTVDFYDSSELPPPTILGWENPELGNKRPVGGKRPANRPFR